MAFPSFPSYFIESFLLVLSHFHINYPQLFHPQLLPNGSEQFPACVNGDGRSRLAQSSAGAQWVCMRGLVCSASAEVLEARSRLPVEPSVPTAASHTLKAPSDIR